MRSGSVLKPRRTTRTGVGFPRKRCPELVSLVDVRPVTNDDSLLDGAGRILFVAGSKVNSKRQTGQRYRTPGRGSGCSGFPWPTRRPHFGQVQGIESPKGGTAIGARGEGARQ